MSLPFPDYETPFPLTSFLSSTQIQKYQGKVRINEKISPQKKIQLLTNVLFCERKKFYESLPLPDYLLASLQKVNPYSPKDVFNHLFDYRTITRYFGIIERRNNPNELLSVYLKSFQKGQLDFLKILLLGNYFINRFNWICLALHQVENWQHEECILISFNHFLSVLYHLPTSSAFREIPLHFLIDLMGNYSFNLYQTLVRHHLTAVLLKNSSSDISLFYPEIKETPLTRLLQKTLSMDNPKWFSFTVDLFILKPTFLENYQRTVLARVFLRGAFFTHDFVLAQQLMQWIQSKMYPEHFQGFLKYCIQDAWEKNQREVLTFFCLYFSCEPFDFQKSLPSLETVLIQLASNPDLMFSSWVVHSITEDPNAKFFEKNVDASEEFKKVIDKAFLEACQKFPFLLNLMLSMDSLSLEILNQGLTLSHNTLLQNKIKEILARK